MTVLSTMLSEILNQDKTINGDALKAAYELAQALEQQNKDLKQEVLNLKDIIQEVRKRDANKKCLCRGRP